MIDHYNAFISYRHAPLDQKIAAHIQKSLERFHIPHKIVKKTGNKRIQQIFRDKDELPITSSLNETISNALDNSDFLIVICSTNTKESMWVKREISYFLEHHSRNHVLTVLCDGEPDEVIPEELLYEEREVTDTDGQKHMVRVPLEPLSCDYRLPMKDADKEELPRLAAALIGCSYDELMRRRRQYRIRRMTAIFSIVLAVTLAFGGYMFYSVRQINKNYREAMYRRSLYLANESARLYKENNRIDAIHLALAALPSEENKDMPVTAEAVKALTDSTMAYKSLQGTLSIAATWNYKMPGFVTNYSVTFDGKYLVATDSSDNIILWKTEDKKKVFESDDAPAYFCFSSDDKYLFLIYSKKVICIECKSGEEKWDYEYDRGFYTNATMTGKKDLYLLAYDKVIKLSYKDGDDEVFDIEGLRPVNSPAYLSPSEDKILVEQLGEAMDSELHVYNLNDCSDKVFGETVARLGECAWTDDSNIAVTVPDGYYNYTIGTAQLDVNNEKTLAYFSLNTDSMTKNWEGSMEYHSTNHESERVLFCSEKSVLTIAVGEHLVIFNSADGSILHDYDTKEMILWISDRNSTGFPTYVTDGGDVGFTNVNESGDFSYEMNRLPIGMDCAVISEGIFIHTPESYYVTYFDVYVQDDNWTKVDEGYIATSSISCYDEDRCAVLGEKEDGYEISLIDFDSAEVEKKIPYDGSIFDFCDMSFLDGELYVVREDEDYTLSICKVDGKKIKELESLECNTTNRGIAFILNNKVWYYTRKEDSYWLCSYDIKTKDKNKILFTEDGGYVNGAPIITDDEKYGFINVNDSFIMVDLEEEKVIKSKAFKSLKNISSVAVSEDGVLAVADEDKVILAKPGEDDSVSIDCAGLGASGLYFADKDTILVAYSSGRIGKYDANTGKLLKFAEVEAPNYKTSVNGTFRVSGKNMYVNMSGTLNVIDIESFYCVANIENCICYNEGSDRFYTFAYTSMTEGMLGYFDHYSLEDLIAKAKDIIRDETLSEEQKNIYGI